MTTFAHRISGIRVIPAYGSLQDVVFEVDWYVEANDGTYWARYSNTSRVGGPDPQNFIPFADLTEADVKGWLPDPITEEVQRMLTDKIAAQRAEAEAQAKPLPWEAAP